MGGEIRIGALISGTGTNLQAIVDACESKQIRGRVVFVGSDNPVARGLSRAEKQGIPTFVVDYQSVLEPSGPRSLEQLAPKDFVLERVLALQNIMPSCSNRDKLATYFRTRAIAEAALLKEMAAYPFDLLVLAGFMRVLSPYFIDRVNTDPSRPRIMNIHPALLPSFPGADGYGDTYRYGCKVGGCTVHFVDYGEDTGPIIGQKAFEIQPEDALATVREKGLKLEWELYPTCIALFAEDRLKVVFKTYALQNGTEFKRKVVVQMPLQKP
jgi:phosphoribosylglycinamide formyltransferase-1